MGRWQERVQKVEEQLRTGEYRKAAGGATKLLRSMERTFGPGEGAAARFAVICAFRAIAEAGLGNDDAAFWYWDVARNIYAEIEELDLSPYGEAATLLERAQPCCEPRGTILPEREAEPIESIQIPEVTKKPRITYPEAFADLQVEARYNVELLIGTDGLPREPRILTPVDEPAMAYTILETVRRWSFKPARVNGELRACCFHLIVEFHDP